VSDELETKLEGAMWVPRRLRDLMRRTLLQSGQEGRALLAVALATGTVPGLEFWNELCVSILAKDTERRFTEDLLRHGITVAGARTASVPALREALERIRTVPAVELPAARAALLSLGSGVSLANAHGLYVAATRKAQKSSLPKAPPHLGGPVPELTVLETVEVAVAMARHALETKAGAEAKELLRLAELRLAWERTGGKGKPPASRANVPDTSKAKGPAFAVARAALMEAVNTDHVSSRGTSIKSAVTWGLELGEAWWLEQLDEALMLADARAAFEKKGQRTSKPIVHLVWRGGDKTTRLWLVRLKSGTYALLAKLGRNWTTVEGDLESVAASVPDAWFARAMQIIEQRR
jgi:hypothetical protein